MPKIIPLCINGEDSLTKFIKELIRKHPGQQKQYVTKLINTLVEFEEKGPSINQNHKNFIPFKKIEGNKYDGIYELRTKKCRFFLFKEDSDIYIGLQGFEKKTNKTPQNELERARKEVQSWVKTKN